MIPVTQTKVVVFNSQGAAVQRGNCYAACIASILELPITEVPNIETLYAMDGTFYYEVLCKWLAHLGYEMTTDGRFGCFHGDRTKDCFIEELQNQYYIVSGKSPRGIQHACIYKNGKMIHDPHPTREGLVTEEHFESITVI